MSTVTAMYIFSGYRDSIKESLSESDINFNFSGGGEIDSAERISHIARLFDKGFVFPKKQFPGVLEYEVLEKFGRVIAGINEAENDYGNSYYLARLTGMVMRWIMLGKV